MSRACLAHVSFANLAKDRRPMRSISVTSGFGRQEPPIGLFRIAEQSMSRQEHSESNGDGLVFGTHRVQTGVAELSLPETLPLEHWELVGEHLQGMTRNVQWWWGDWLNFGERQYGTKYQSAVNRFGLKLKTAQQYAWVARAFPASLRRELSWSHHKEVAGIEDADERDQLLTEAIRGRWTKAKLRAVLKDGARLGGVRQDGSHPPTEGVGGPNEADPLGVGLDCAEEALNSLEQIPVDDPARFDAFDRVSDWIVQHRWDGGTQVSDENRGWAKLRIQTLGKVRQYCHRNRTACVAVENDLRALLKTLRRYRAKSDIRRRPRRDTPLHLEEELDADKTGEAKVQS